MPRKKPPKSSGDDDSGVVALLHLYPKEQLLAPDGVGDGPHSGYNNANAKPPSARRRFLHAYEKTFGNVSASCEYAGIKRTTYYRWMHSKTVLNRHFQAKIKLIKPDEYLLDTAEALHIEQMTKFKNPTAIMFTLKSKGRKRGWSEKDIPRELTEEEQAVVDQIKRQVALRAQEKGVQYSDELKNYLRIFGQEIKPEFAETLATDLVN